MRINRSALLTFASDTVAQRIRKERNIISAYLTGSLLGEDYLLGGTADIDLVFIHLDEIPVEREIVHLTDEVHLDIAHYSQKTFANPRRLRLDPWLGHAISSARLLHDTQHFMDFTQASVRGQFDRPEVVLARARPLLDHARQLWAALASSPPAQPQPSALAHYLHAVGHAANAIAVLSGPPLTERRLLLNFPRRAAAAGRAGLSPGLLGMLGASHVSAEDVLAWLPGWEAAFDAVPDAQRPPRLDACRRKYYRQAFLAMLAGEHPHAVLWPLLRTWISTASSLPEAHPALTEWREACLRLGLADQGFSERISALDVYLDTVDETMDVWARENGV
jgi:hypothetical protein